MPNPGPFRTTLLSGVITGTSQPQNVAGAIHLVAYVTGVNTISAGTLLIEEADWDPATGQPYAGTWSQVTSIDLTALSGGGSAGKTSAYHFSADAAFAFLRARLSVDVTGAGGAVTVVLRGQG